MTPDTAKEALETRMGAGCAVVAADNCVQRMPNQLTAW